MRPGLHSGTLPKLYARMRHAEARADDAGALRKLGPLARKGHHIEQSVRRFVQREMGQLLMLSRGWGGQQMAVGDVRLGSNRIAVELLCPGLQDEPVWIAFEEQSRWLLAGVSRTGWLAALDERQRKTFEVALAGLYKAAGVDMVREQLAAILGPGQVPYDIAEETLVVWPPAHGGDATKSAALTSAVSHGSNYETEVVYNLTLGRRMAPRISQSRAGQPPKMPILDSRQILFRDVPILWSEWLTVWVFDQADAIYPDAIAHGMRILPPMPADPPATAQG